MFFACGFDKEPEVMRAGYRPALPHNIPIATWSRGYWIDAVYGSYRPWIDLTQEAS